MDLQYEIEQTLKEAGLKCHNVPCTTNRNNDYASANGIYVNFLRMEEYIFLPIYNREEDDEVINLFEETFDKTIVPVKSNEVAREGGVLNCISWTVKR